LRVDRARRPSRSASPTQSEATITPRLLLVDDSEAPARGLAQLLAGEGTVVRVARLDGETLARLDRHEFALAVVSARAGGAPPWPHEALAGRVPTLVVGLTPPPGLPFGVAYLPPPARATAIQEAARKLLREGREPPLWREEFEALTLPAADRAMLLHLAPGSAAVLCLGEPGSGRASVTRFLHGVRAAVSRPLVRAETTPVDAADLERLLTAAAGGTLVFPEVSTLPPALQDLLAARLESEAAQSEGPRLVFVSDVPEVEPLLAELRPRLAQRLEARAVALPPLRTDPARAVACAEAQLRLARRRFNLAAIALDESARRAVAAYAWPGNVAELRARLERAALRAQDGSLAATDLGLEAAAPPAATAAEVERTALAAPGAAADSPASVLPPTLEALMFELAHEVKNPLVSIKTFTQLLGERFADPEFRDQYYKLVLNDVERIDSVLSEVIDFAQIGRPQPGRVDLNRLVRRVLDSHPFQVRKASVVVSARLSEEPLLVHTDEELAYYVVSNVARDALAALNPAGRLEVTTSLNPEHGLVLVRYCLTQGGSGGPLRLATPATKRKMLGLRLTLASAVALSLGATIEAEDTKDGLVAVAIRFPAWRF